jgi:hypothetical protein
MKAKLDVKVPAVVFRRIMGKLITRKNNHKEEITPEKVFNATFDYLSESRVILYKKQVAEAFRDQKRYRTLIQSGSYMPSVLGLWTLNDHKKIFKNNQTTYPKKVMDAAVDSVIALNSRKKKDE